MKTQPLILALCFVLTSCATRPLTYHPPSSTKMNASSQRVSTAVVKAKATAQKAKNKVTEAQGSGSEISTLSGTIKEQLDKLPNVPPELTDNFLKLQSVESVLTSQLAEATVIHNQLQQELLEAEAAKTQLQKDMSSYVIDAGKLADSATTERDKRIDAEKKLSWYRWHSWLMKIATGAIILVIIVVIFLWVTGRLAGLASKFV